jgi:hypothetical protein
MSKLGTHNTLTTGSHAPDELARAALRICAFCDSPATHRCARCKNPVCDDHHIERIRFHWQTFHTFGTRVSMTWNHYVPNGTWHVCPRCAAELQAQNAHEHAKDRNMLLRRRVFVGALLVLAFSLLVLAIYHKMTQLLPVSPHVLSTPIP